VKLNCLEFGRVTLIENPDSYWDSWRALLPLFMSACESVFTGLRQTLCLKAFSELNLLALSASIIVCAKPLAQTLPPFLFLASL
jgi:hypothetical protein